MKLVIKTSQKKIKITHPLVLIMADGRTLKEDLDRFMSFKIKHDAYSVARSYKLYPGIISHWANVDAEEAIWWAEHLPDREKILTHTFGECRGFDVDWDVVGMPPDWENFMWHGSTALFAVYTSLVMGYKKMVLAGVPLDTNGHWYDPPDLRGPRWTPETYPAWMDFAKSPDGPKVKSMSGYTAQILGEPTKQWLKN